jgi:hypothetical protein
MNKLRRAASRPLRARARILGGGVSATTYANAEAERRATAPHATARISGEYKAVPRLFEAVCAVGSHRIQSDPCTLTSLL